MADITELLKNILSKVYGKDVRQSIHDAIQQCYLDGKVGAIDMVARARIDNLVAQNNDTSGNSELKDIRVDYCKRYMRENGYPPSVREICEGTGLKSTSSVCYYMKQMRKLGLIISGPELSPRAFTLPGVRYTFEDERKEGAKNDRES